MDNLDFTNLFFDDDEFVIDRPSDDEESITFGGGKYTSKVQAPHYIPSGPCPSISEFVDTRKYEELIQKINASNVSDDNKRFLRLAAARHIVFNFGKIANYYTYADKELQQLMEDSALVLIDFNDAVRNGFIKLDSRIDEFVDAQLALEKEEKLELGTE